MALALLLDAQLRGATPDLAVGLVDMCRLWDGSVHCWRNPAGPTALAGVGDVTPLLAPAADSAPCQLVAGLVLDLTAQHRHDRFDRAAAAANNKRARRSPNNSTVSSPFAPPFRVLEINRPEQYLMTTGSFSITWFPNALIQITTHVTAFACANPRWHSSQQPDTHTGSSPHRGSVDRNDQNLRVT